MAITGTRKPNTSTSGEKKNYFVNNVTIDSAEQVESPYHDASVHLKLTDTSNGYNYNLFVNQNFEKDTAGVVTELKYPDNLNLLYVKMKTPVDPVPEKDEAEIEKSYANPDRFDQNKLFPNSNLEFQRPTKYDVIGFITCFGICFVIIGLVLLVAQIGT